jgi:hypothetical protein
VKDKLECDGWVIRLESDPGYQVGKIAPTPEEVRKGQSRIIIKPPDGEELDPYYWGEDANLTTVRRRLSERGLDDDCVDRVLEMIGFSGPTA